MSKEITKLQKIAGIVKENAYEDDFYINVAVRDAKKAIEIIRDDFSREYRNKNIQLDGTDSYVINDRNIAIDLFDAFKENDIEIIDTDVEVQDSDFDGSSIQEDEINEAAYVPENVAKFAKRKGVSALVNKVAGWAEKAGKGITGGTAIGKNYDTLILDLRHQDGAIYIDISEGTIELYGEPVNSAKSFAKALEANDQSKKD
jgi:hypothetical protein